MIAARLGLLTRWAVILFGILVSLAVLLGLIQVVAVSMVTLVLLSIIVAYAEALWIRIKRALWWVRAKWLAFAGWACRRKTDVIPH